MTTQLAIEKMPYWPRKMQIDLAALYCGLSEPKFRIKVRKGIYPAGRDEGVNGKRWYIEELDAAMDREKGMQGHPDDDILKPMVL